MRERERKGEIRKVGERGKKEIEREGGRREKES